MIITNRLKLSLANHPDDASIVAFNLIKTHKRIIQHTLNTIGSIATIRELYKRIDAEYARVIDGVPISCKKGCSFCCHQNVDMTSFEADLIYDYCAENGIEIDSELFKKQIGLTLENRFGSKISACPFLKDNLCSIYPVRPIACRTYFVLSKPAKCDGKKYPKGRTKLATSIIADCMACALDNIMPRIPMQEIFSKP